MLSREQLQQNIEAMESQGASQEEIQGYLDSQASSPVSRETPTPAPAPEKKSFGGFMGNLADSTGNFFGGLATAVTHPVQTVKTLGQLGLGAMDNVAQFNERMIDKLPVGDTFKKVASTGMNMINPLTAIPTGLRTMGVNLDSSNALADSVGQEYKNRYGGVDNIGETLYKDPVGVLADLATVLSGGAGAVGKVGKVAQIGSTAGKVAEAGKIAQAGNIASKASKVSSFLTKASSAVDPLQIALKTGSKVTGFAKAKGLTPLNAGFKTMGLTTGRGSETFSQIYEAARNNRTGAVNAMRGGADDAKIMSSLDKADNALRQMARDERAKLGLDSKTGSLDISPIVNELENQLDNFRIKKNADGTLDFKDSKIRFDKNSQTRINTIYDEMKDYGLRPGQRTADSVDSLKQALGTLFDDSSEVKAFVQAVKGKTRNVLSQVDGYDEYSKNYGEIMDTLADLKNELKSKNKNPQMTWNKLVNTFKQKNTEARQAIVRKLQDEGISDLADELAGYTAKDALPSDFLRFGAGGFAVSSNPLLLPALSPRVMGELTNFIGKNTGRAERFNAFIKSTTKNGTQKVPASKVIQWLGSQVYDKTRATRSSTLQQRLEEAQDNED